MDNHWAEMGFSSPEKYERYIKHIMERQMKEAAAANRCAHRHGPGYLYSYRVGRDIEELGEEQS